ncbi:type II and III secretion system protein family protein [Shewanella sairae]|uniref:type II and III secretion system protein family protein n=1 Tax=Shewanella sairae TaxID=190310 RepID=UPI001C7E60CB|nr:pilus assembly protein N-terminal domain-containing protein [Shewanella sairae]MCL1132458.1 pilus assembly protein N-terminal domain-containing protein [Shewanella sairae]
MSFRFFILILLVCSFPSYSENYLLLSKGEAKTIYLSSPAETVFISAPRIADYKIISPKTIVVYGGDFGTSSIVAFDSTGREVYKNSIIVNMNTDLISDIVKSKFPNEDIKITNASDTVILDGVVSSYLVKNEIYNVVGLLLNKNSERSYYKVEHTDEAKGWGDDDLEYTERYYFDGILNNLKVISINQINVKITLAEVSSAFLTNLGVTYGSDAGQGVFTNNLLDFSAQNIVASIAAIGDESIGKVLAEPNLTVFSGEQASFLVGGELPIAVQNKDSITIEYKEYGVLLSMVAKVVDKNNIRLTLEPEVSSFDELYKTTGTSMNVPAFKTRRAQTTVQLKDGQSFILGGLLSSQNLEQVSKIPFLGDIPLLGGLFRNTGSKGIKTELIIVATVNLVEPVAPESVRLPKLRPTSEVQRLLLLDFSNKQTSPELVDIINNGGFN